MADQKHVHVEFQRKIRKRVHEILLPLEIVLGNVHARQGVYYKNFRAIHARGKLVGLEHHFRVCLALEIVKHHVVVQEFHSGEE